MKRNEVKQWSDSLPPPNHDEAEWSEAMERSPPPNRDEAERSEARKRFPNPQPLAN